MTHHNQLKVKSICFLYKIIIFIATLKAQHGLRIFCSHSSVNVEAANLQYYPEKMAHKMGRTIRHYHTRDIFPESVSMQGQNFVACAAVSMKMQAH